MKTSTNESQLQRLLAQLGDCLTPESARRLLAMKADRKFQARMNDLADRCTEGSLTKKEHAEYGTLVNFVTFVAILKSKARQLLDTSKGD